MSEYDKAETPAGARSACRNVSSQDGRGLQIVGTYTCLRYVRYLRGQHGDALRIFQPPVEALAGLDHALKERSLIELDRKIGAAYLP